MIITHGEDCNPNVSSAERRNSKATYSVYYLEHTLGLYQRVKAAYRAVDIGYLFSTKLFTISGITSGFALLKNRRRSREEKEGKRGREE